MKNSIRQRPSNRQKLRTRFVLISGATIMLLTFTMGWLVFLNISLNVKIKATANGSGGASLSNGEIVGRWKFDNDNWRSITGIGNIQHSPPDGDYITSSPVFDSEGIDVGIDFKRPEPLQKDKAAKSSNIKSVETGSFFSRGKSLDFGLSKGYLVVSYSITTAKGGHETIGEKTSYEIPADNQFRNYRFIYTPTTGKAEIFVNNVIVWNHQGGGNTSMYWANAGNITIGKGINGIADQPVLDNLVIRTLNTPSPLAESLISFSLENSGSGIMIIWSTIVNGKVDYFALERSMNGIDFERVDNIHAAPEQKEFAEYSFEDKSVSSPTVIFYRIRQVFKDGKISADAISAIKIRPNKILTIDKVTPDPFQTMFNISYFAPSAGRVWIELVDEHGKIKSTETFQAQQGRNIYFFHDKNNLSTGNYMLNLIQNDKRVSAKVTKI